MKQDQPSSKDVKELKPATKDLGPIPNITGDVFADLYNMHRRFGFHKEQFGMKALRHRVAFLQEEIDEIKLAIQNKNAGDVLDGFIDLIVVAAGGVDLACAHGNEAWIRVMNANNRKQVGYNNTRPDSDGVDLIKPEGWEPPYLEDLVGNLRSILHEGTVFDQSVTKFEATSPFDEEANPFLDVAHVGVDRANQKNDKIEFSSSDVSRNPPYLVEKIGDNFIIDGLTYILGHQDRLTFHYCGDETIRPYSSLVCSFCSYKGSDFNPISRLMELRSIAQTLMGNEELSNSHEDIPEDRMAVQVLQDCIDLMRRKAQDYTSANSAVTPAEYYPNGIDDLIYMIDVLKRLRMISVLDNMRAGGKPNFDSLKDILQDRIVYLALALEWLEGAMIGQNQNNDIWNNPLPLEL